MHMHAVSPMYMHAAKGKSLSTCSAINKSLLLFMETLPVQDEKSSSLENRVVEIGLN